MVVSGGTTGSVVVATEAGICSVVVATDGVVVAPTDEICPVLVAADVVAADVEMFSVVVAV
jgi:hypothetical protein